MSDNTVDFPGLTAQGKALDAVLGDLEQSAGRFGTAMTSALSAAARSGKGLDDILKSAALRLVDIALSAGLKPLQTSVSNGIGSIFESLATSVSGATSAGLSSPTAAPLAGNGTVATPAVLSGLSALGGQDGGAAGASGAPGGAASAAVSGASSPANVTFNVTASDADSFRRSEGQITAMLTRAVGRGRRGT